MRRALLAAAGILLLATWLPAPASARRCGQGDPPITTSRHTSCPLAAAIVNRVYNGPVLRGSRVIVVLSPVTHRRYRIRVVRRGDSVTATGARGIWARFYYDGW
jgi:hypothetical protein